MLLGKVSQEHLREIRDRDVGFRIITKQETSELREDDGDLDNRDRTQGNTVRLGKEKGTHKWNSEGVIKDTEGTIGSLQCHRGKGEEILMGVRESTVPMPVI